MTQRISRTMPHGSAISVFIPKYRKKAIFGVVKKRLATCSMNGARRESKIEEGHLMPDHVHMLISFRRNIPWRR